MTGTSSFSPAQRAVSGSVCSPARNARRQDVSWAAPSSAFGSTFLTARKAVGAVKKTSTPCSAITRKKAPASGVPTGLPSYITEVQPSSSSA